MAAKRPHVMTPARQAHLDAMRAKAAAKRAAEGTGPQREGARKRHARPPVTAANESPARADGAGGEVRFTDPPPPPPAPVEAPPPPAPPSRPTPAGDVRRLLARLRRPKGA
ncbi:MAG: hypothetical protein EPO65_07655 [Dehalococcoidia bacterium]|nr:MAG: hypothetical protein EPO65_07655 [Dehalococcoidia bacterium]